MNAASPFALALLAACAATPEPEAPQRQMRQQRQVTALAALAASAATIAAAPGTGTLPFIDAHAHLNDEAMQLSLMAEHGATCAVVFWGGRSDNASVAAAAQRHADRLIAFASISPERTAYRPAWERDDPALLQQLDDLLASGRYLGIGEISAVHFPSAGFDETDFSPLSPMMAGIMALARKHRMPVLLHVEATRLPELSVLLERHADVSVIWAHGGYTPLFLAQRLLQRHPNLVYELSARSWPLHPRSPDYTVLRDGHQVWPQWLALIEAMPQRFVIGTDASGRSRESDAMKFASVQNLLRQLSPAALGPVARGNMVRLLGPRAPAGCAVP